MCLHRLAEQGRLDLNAPVVRYWPEFGQAGKDKMPVTYLLNHKAGLPAIKAKIPGEMLYDWAAMTTALAAHTPWWEPGTRHGYHAFTYGYLIGEVLRRIPARAWAPTSVRNSPRRWTSISISGWRRSMTPGSRT